MSVPSRYNKMIDSKIKSMSKKGPNDGDFGFDSKYKGGSCCYCGGSGFGANNVGRLGDGQTPKADNLLKGYGKVSGEGKYKKKVGLGNLTSYKESSFGSTKSEDYGKMLSADKNAYDHLLANQNFPVEQQPTEPTNNAPALTTGSGRKMKGMGKNAVVGGSKKKQKIGFGNDLEGGNFFDDITKGVDTVANVASAVAPFVAGKKPRAKKSKAKSEEMEGGDFWDTLKTVGKTALTVAPYAMMAMGKPKKGGANFIDKSQMQGVKGGAKPKSEWQQLVAKHSKTQGGVKNAIKYIKDNYKKENGKWIKN